MAIRRAPVSGDGLREAAEPDQRIDTQIIHAFQFRHGRRQRGERFAPLTALEQIHRAAEPRRSARLHGLDAMQEDRDR